MVVSTETNLLLHLVNNNNECRYSSILWMRLGVSIKRKGG